MAQGFLDERRKKKKKLEEKKKLTIEGERTPEEREEIRETKTIPERAAQFQEEKRRQEAADPLLTAPSSAIKGGTVELPDGRVFSGLSTKEVGEIQQREGIGNQILQPKLDNKETLQFMQQQKEQERKQVGFEALAEDAQAKVDKLQNLAKAGIIPFSAVHGFINSNLADFGFDVQTDEEIFASTQRLSEDKLGRLPFVALGALTTTGITLPGVGKISLATLFGRRSELSALRGDASLQRETSESILRHARDSQDYDSAIQNYETLIEANRFKHSEIHRLLKSDPNSVAAGVTDAVSMNRDQNRLIGDLGVLERAKLTGDQSELNRLLLSLDLVAAAKAQQDQN